jgi:hypothetical protein
MKVRRSLVLAAIITLLSSMSYAKIRVGIIYNDEQISVLKNGLLQYNDFEQIDLISWNSTPNPVTIANYDSVIVTARYAPVTNSKQWGDIIADYAQAGGGVVLGFAFYSTGGPVVDYGKLADPLHTPFTRGPIIAGDDDSLGNILLPSNPIMDGVTELTTAYRYGVTVNTGATVAASFISGIPLAGFMDVGDGRVVGIQAAYKLNPYFTNEGDFMQLYRNAAVYSVPEPCTLLLLGLGAAIVTRKR